MSSVTGNNFSWLWSGKSQTRRVNALYTYYTGYTLTPMIDVATIIGTNQGRRLRETGGYRPPQKVRWRGRKCFYPPQYLENV